MHAIGIYVDDFPIASNSTKCMQQVTNKLKEKSPVKDLGPMEHFLGMKVTWNRIKARMNSGEPVGYTQPLFVANFRQNLPKPTQLASTFGSSKMSLRKFD